MWKKTNYINQWKGTGDDSSIKEVTSPPEIRNVVKILRMVGPKFQLVLKCAAPVSKFKISIEKSAKIPSFFRATCNLLIETNWLDWVERMRNVDGQSKILARPARTKKLSITKKGIALKALALIKNDKCTISKIRLCWTHSKFCHKMTHWLCSMSN